MSRMQIRSSERKKNHLTFISKTGGLHTFMFQSWHNIWAHVWHRKIKQSTWNSCGLTKPTLRFSVIILKLYFGIVSQTKYQRVGKNTASPAWSSAVAASRWDAGCLSAEGPGRLVRNSKNKTLKKLKKMLPAALSKRGASWERIGFYLAISDIAPNPP